jgi:hypothetical protein
MSNLEKLTDISLDEGIYRTMNDLSVKNCPAMDPYSYRIVLGEAPVTNYIFTDFNWTVDTVEGLHVDESGKVDGITVVDKLMTKIPEGGTPAAAFIGNITVDIDCNVDEFEIYNKYCKTYPNLIINYTNNVTGLDPAVILTFMTGNEEGSVVHYRVLGSGEADGATIGELISANGPLGVAMTTPMRQPTTSETYTFTGYWIDQNGARYYQPEIVTEPAEGEHNFNSFVPTSSLTLYPEFITDVRGYEVVFKDYDGNIIQ